MWVGIFFRISWVVLGDFFESFFSFVDCVRWLFWFFVFCRVLVDIC